MSETILVIDDSSSAADVASYLKDAGYEVEWFSEGEQGLDFMRNTHVDMLLSYKRNPLHLPMIEEAKRDGRRIPVLILADQQEPEQIVDCFSLGADDVVAKPVNMKILLARVNNLLRLFGKMNGNGRVIKLGKLQIDLKSHEVRVNHERVELTPKEYNLLLYLARHVDQVCSREDILHHVWGYDFQIDTNVVDVYIRHLRQKLERNSKHKWIQTIRGVGYMIRKG
ncbi:response regulator transcription factor [Paenibacillus sp. JX-17]|uniref:Response regulator transcription factor n=1 Tax=Paenibacillus lacisoli TaxID=3064525 RepID=A0ABT9C6M4_9BACL|nr:response regulator transcription factor [Paenibacillus sp. JX-17]MDO7904910.1 response regulator transcription factor [Paenibacillus sp. JX-17]